MAKETKSSQTNDAASWSRQDDGSSFSILLKPLRQNQPDWEWSWMQFSILLACREQDHESVGKWQVWTTLVRSAVNMCRAF